MGYEKIDKNRIGLIHVAKEALGIKEEDYRAMLKSNFNVTSSKDLTIPQFERLMEIYKKLGFKSKYLTLKQKSNIQKKSKILWKEQADIKLKNFIMQQVGYDIPLARLTVKEAQMVINGLDKVIEWKGEGKYVKRK